MPTVKKHTYLDDGIDVEDESNILVGHRKHIFWQTSINGQRLELRVCINGIFIEGLLDTSANISIITPESWNPN